MPATRLLLKRILVITLAGVVILAGLLVGGVRLLDHLMPSYRHALAERIGHRIDADIDIEAVELRWQWSGPLLELDHVAIRRQGESEPAVTLDSLGLHFSFTDLINGRRTPDGLVLEAPRLALRVGDDGRPKLVHWSRPSDPPLGWDKINAARDMLRFARIQDGRIRLQSEQLPDGRAELDGLDANLQREADGLHWQMSADGANAFSGLTGQGRIEGALPNPANADFDIQADDVDTLALARARNLVDAALDERQTGGELDARLRGRWRDHALAEANLDITLNAVDDSRQSAPIVPEMSASLRAAGGRDPDDIRFVMTRLDSPRDTLADTALTGAFDLAERRLQLDARQVPIAPGLRLARLRLPRLADTRLDGRLDHVSLTAGGDAPLKLGFEFSGLHIDDPAVRAGPLAGSYYQQADTHVLQFSQAGGALSVRRFLNGELAIDDLDGELAWHRADNGWAVNANNLRLASGEANIAVNGRVDLPDGGTPVVDLAADASAPDVARLLQRIPQAKDLPNQRLRDWLPKAITAGTLDQGHLEIAGPLDRFPFAEPREGERFHLSLTGHGLDVTYKPEWPPLHEARGTLTLDGDDLRIEVDRSKMLGVTLGRSVGRVANVREPVLHLDGRVDNGRAEKLLAFLAQSPLRKRFGQLVKAVDVTGPASLSLNLRLPLKPGLGEPKVSGEVGARGDTLRHDALPGPITDIRGQIAFDQTGLRARGLTGDLLGVAVKTDLEPRPDASQHIDTHARIELPADADALAHYLPRPWLDYAHGATDLRVAFDVKRQGGVSSIKATSDLQGLTFDLPAPMTKDAATTAPLDMTIAGDGSRVDIDYDRRLDVAVRLADGRPTRVQALLNDPGVTPPDTDGVWIGGRADTLDGLNWFYLVRHLLEATGAYEKDSEPGLAFIGGDLRIGALRLDNRYFKNTHVRVHPLNAAPGWRVDLEGPNTQGQFTWTQPAGDRVTIAGDLARLALQTRDQTHKAQTPQDTSPVFWQDVDPTELPQLDVSVAQLQVDETNLGRATLSASALDTGWQLGRFALGEGDLTGWATGRWTRDDGRTEASGQSRFEGHGLSGLLRTLGYAPSVRARRARVHSQFEIKPNPNGLDLRALDGSVNLALDDGTLLSVEPGPARVLGLINLYVLPRRLQLDFRDVVDKGLAFDAVRAHFNIENGDAYGDDVRIETPSSRIRIDGRIGLAARDYDERVTITPKVGSGVAIASTVFGGPIVGAAVFAVQELLKKPIQKVSSVSYTLKGGWDDPRIAEPSAEQ